MVTGKKNYSTGQKSYSTGSLICRHYFFKVTDTLTVILTTRENGKIIATYDWTLMTYQELAVGFTNDRHYCSCGLLRKPNGQPIVAAANKR